MNVKYYIILFIFLMCLTTGCIADSKPDISSLEINYSSEALNLFNEKRYVEALEYFDKAIYKDPKNFELYYYRGVCYSNVTKYEDAISNYTISLEYFTSSDLLDPNKRKIYSSIFYQRGMAYLSMEDQTLALEDFINSSKYDSETPNLFYNLGELYHLKRDFRNAFLNYEMALKLGMDASEDLNKKLAYSYKKVGYEYYDKFDYDNAILYWDKSLKLDPSDYEELYVKNVSYIYFVRGNEFFEKKEYRKAIEQYKKAIKINPEFGEAYYNTGLAYNHLGYADDYTYYISKGIGLLENKSNQ